MSFEVRFPQIGGAEFIAQVEIGSTLFLLGANGSGKSSLITLLAGRYSGRCRRVSAHRRTWLQTDTVNISPNQYDEFSRYITNSNSQPRSRWVDEYGDQQSMVKIYELANKEIEIDRELARAYRAGNHAEANRLANLPTPTRVISNIMRLSNMPINIALVNNQKLIASKQDGTEYSAAQLSDGERNALLIAADVLTAPSGSLLLIDEPERHLHRSIISPLLTSLFHEREDCAFIVATHEISLPIDSPSSQTLLVRACSFSGEMANAWSVDLVESAEVVDEQIRRDILGSRKRMLYVEGKDKSLDTPLYTLLFPDVSIVAKDGCKEVEASVRWLRDSEDLHWVEAFGIVDNDRRNRNDIDRLHTLSIFVLPYYSVESLYYHPVLVRALALKCAGLTGENPDTLFGEAIYSAINAVMRNRSHLINLLVEKFVRFEISSNMPTRAQLEAQPVYSLTIDVATIRRESEEHFDRLIANVEYEELLRHFPVRQSECFSRIATRLGFRNCKKYEQAVITLLQADAAKLAEVRALVGISPEWSN